MSKKTNIIETTAIPLPISNVDTDQIIPARFLKAISKDSFGKNLFYDWRYKKDGSVKEDFVLNNDKYKGNILVCGTNFGCGSSREHAAWAIKDYGFEAIICSSFADIFKSNALNNGILTIEVKESLVKEILTKITKKPSTKISINLQSQTISLDDIRENFDIDSYKKSCLLNGYDDIDFILSIKDEIINFEKKNNYL